MNFINKIGQRNYSKILILVSAFTCFLEFMVEKTVSSQNVVIGIILFMLPNLILSLIAHKNKDYRLFSIIASTILLLLNNLLFLIKFKLILFLIILIQIIVTSIFYFFVHILETKKKEKQIKNKKEN
jgi:hypothetical protein